MAASNTCIACSRALQRHTSLPQSTYRSLSRRGNHQPTIRRTLTTTTFRQASQPPPPPKPFTPPTPSDPLTNIASTLRTNLRSATEPYIAFGGTEDLFRACAQQCSYTIPSARASPPTPPPKTATGEDLGQGEGWWLEPRSSGGLGLDATFNTWAQVMFLHLWLLTVRLRCFPEKYVRDWHQNLQDHFFFAAEERMATWHGMSARGTRNKYLKDLWAQLRGTMLSYDEGLIRGDAVMAGAVWRNVFKADEGVDLGDVAVVVAYVMRELQMLGRLSDPQVSEGKVVFGDPRTIDLGNLRSVKMKEPFSPAELAQVKEEQVKEKA